MSCNVLTVCTNCKDRKTVGFVLRGSQVYCSVHFSLRELNEQPFGYTRRYINRLID